ncbi:MAG: sodium:solute symporter family protein [Rickettsiaceae bacterium]|jgi:Na+/proline symporter|nr:sodium:solute symporter family protein [Rickettsiaceae bacterium]
MITVDNSIYDLIIILSYLAFTLALGIWYGFNVKTLREFAVGDKRFTVLVVVATIVATWVDGGSVIAPTGNAYRYGIIALFPQLGIVLYLYIISRFIAPLMQPYLNMLSVAEIVGSIYGVKARLITAVLATFRSFGGMSIQVFVMGNLFEYIFPASKFECMLLGTIVLGIYSTFGGIKAVAFTDVFQLLTVAIIIPALIFVAFKEVGGVENFIANLPSTHVSLNHAEDLWINYTSLFIYFLIPSLIPTAVQSMLIAKDVKQISSSFKISSIILFLFYMFTIFLGIICFQVFPNLEPHHTVMFLVDHLMPSILKGITVCGLLSVMMSTADLHLNVASVSLTNDYLKVFNPNITDNEGLLYSRIISIILAMLSLYTAYNANNVLDLLVYADSFWRPIVTPPLLLGLLGFRSSSKVFIIASIFGMGSFFICEYLHIFQHLSKIYSILVGFFVNGISLIAAHYLLKEKGGWAERYKVVN